MGRHDPDNRSDSLSPAQAAEDDESGTAASDGERVSTAASSLMSVQIRRSRSPRKRAPSGPTPCGPTTAPETKASAPANQLLNPAAPRSATQAGGNRETQRTEKISAYWARLRGSRPCPAVSDLDPELIAAEWPNSILFRCRAGSGALMPDMSFLPRQNSGGSLGLSTDDAKIQLSPLMLQWLVSLAGDAVRNRRPIEDTEAFPSARKAIGYRAIALPLSDSRSEIDHVLCHVTRA